MIPVTTLDDIIQCHNAIFLDGSALGGYFRRGHRKSSTTSKNLEKVITVLRKEQQLWERYCSLTSDKTYVTEEVHAELVKYKRILQRSFQHWQKNKDRLQRNGHQRSELCSSLLTTLANVQQLVTQFVDNIATYRGPCKKFARTIPASTADYTTVEAAVGYSGLFSNIAIVTNDQDIVDLYQVEVTWREECLDSVFLYRGSKDRFDQTPFLR